MDSESSSEAGKPVDQPEGFVSIELQAGVMTKSGKPMVQVKWAEMEGYLSPAECAQLGCQAQEVAIEAERDAGLMAFFREAGYEDEVIGGILTEMKNHRQQHRIVGVDVGPNHTDTL